jgi:formylmethanofuran dehydrogenase subunit E-like metal-binding protein
MGHRRVIAVNHTLKAEVIANRGILNMMGWKQEATKIEEDNQASIYHSKTTHMTCNLRNLELCTNWIKEKAKDGTCILVKVASADNNYIGTKRVPISIFTKLTSQIIDRSIGNNL